MNIRHIALVSILGILFQGIAFADTVSVEKAGEIASKWLGCEVRQENYGSDAFYVFSGSRGGWIIISAEDAVTPVLGYNETGTFTPKRMPDNLRTWMSGYEKSIKAVRAAGVRQNSEVASLWKTAAYKTKASSRKVLGTALWGQDSPFNDQCPTVVESGRTVRALSGCVATAMSEVIRYHQWPQQGKGTIGGYTYTSDTDKKYTIDSYSIDSHRYDYTLMPLTYSKSSTTAQKAAVAQLMHDCGVMVEAMYNYETGTGAYSENIVNAMVNHMSYSASAQLLYRQAYTDAEWTQIIIREIDCGRPVIYAGSSETDGGHQFVCEGYDERDYLYMNWGWSGDSNGFFTLTLKIPGSYTFDEDHSMVVGLEPDREGDDPVMAGPIIFDCNDETSKGLSITSGSIQGKAFTLAADALTNINYYQDYKGAVKAALVDWKGNLKEYVSEESPLEIPAYNIVTLSGIQCKITGNVAFGDRVLLYYRDSAGNWTPVKGKESYTYPAGKTIYLSSSVPAVDAAFIALPENPVAGDTYYFELVPGSTPIKSVTWYYDSQKQSGVSAILKSGVHRVEASVTLSDGTTETIKAQITVK